LGRIAINLAFALREINVANSATAPDIAATFK